MVINQLWQGMLDLKVHQTEVRFAQLVVGLTEKLETFHTVRNFVLDII